MLIKPHLKLRETSLIRPPLVPTKRGLICCVILHDLYSGFHISDLMLSIHYPVLQCWYFSFTNKDHLAN